MNFKSQYIENKPFVNSILTGFFYFIFSWSIDFGDSTKNLYMGLMLFLPGLTFPFATCYFKNNLKHTPEFTNLLHVLFSVLIYHGCVWLFSAEGRIKFITILAGFAGSLFFQSITKFLLKLSFSLRQIAVVSILSGFAFLPFELIGREGIFIGLAIFLWTVINGQLLNHEYKLSRKLYSV